MLFVRRAERRAREGVAVFVATTTRTGGELRRVELERHDDLVGLDLGSAGTQVDHPLFLVCTHGKHDRCCARYGRPLFDAVAEQVDEDWAWQVSHIGGDRFAGNLLVLPDGVYHGRVEPSDAWAVVEAALEGRLHLPTYRGRSCYGFAAQAAELAVREATGLLGVADAVVSRIAPDGSGWRAVVEAGGAAYEVDVRRERGEATHLTCSTEQLTRPQRFVAGTPRVRAA